jgi:hypothetical protein
MLADYLHDQVRDVDCLFRGFGYLHSSLEPCPPRCEYWRCIHSILISILFRSNSTPQNAKVAHLTAQLRAPSASIAPSGRAGPDTDALDDDELFAELEAEIEDEDGPLREQGLKELQREYGKLLPLVASRPQSDKYLTGHTFLTRAQDGTPKADAGGNAWKVYRADRREGDHPDECVSSLFCCIR